jgi:hypothetical protein
VVLQTLCGEAGRGEFVAGRERGVDRPVAIVGHRHLNHCYTGSFGGDAGRDALGDLAGGEGEPLNLSGATKTCMPDRPA